MGWTATLTSNKEITLPEVESIVSKLPKDLIGGLASIINNNTVPFNRWGWSAATDINVPHNNTLTIGGAYGISGDKGEPMAEFLKKELEELGHEINVEFSWW